MWIISGLYRTYHLFVKSINMKSLWFQKRCHLWLLQNKPSLVLLEYLRLLEWCKPRKSECVLCDAFRWVFMSLRCLKVMDFSVFDSWKELTECD